MSSSKKFTKTVENFVCSVCGNKVKGTGFTDHCPKCLYSKHVDVFPGDREENCGGLMEPIGVTQKNGQWKICYRCQKCGYKKINKITPDDNRVKIVSLSRLPLKESF